VLLVVAVNPALLYADDREAEAVAVIEKLGGKVERDPNREGQPVFKVKLGSTAVTDDDLKCLKELKDLRLLDLSFTQISDKGLVHLESLSQLEVVNDGYTKVTKEGRARLQKALPELKFAAFR
jgi:hypothetical protein